MNASLKFAIASLYAAACLSAMAGSPRIEFRHPVVPVLSRLTHSPALRMTAIADGNATILKGMTLDFGESTDPTDIRSIGLYVSADSTSFDRVHCIGSATTDGQAKVKLVLNAPLCRHHLHVARSDAARFHRPYPPHIFEMRPHRHWQRHPAFPQSHISSTAHRSSPAYCRTRWSRVMPHTRHRNSPRRHTSRHLRRSI